MPAGQERIDRSNPQIDRLGNPGTMERVKWRRVQRDARLGRKGVKQYLARPVIRALATLATFELVACSLAFLVI